MRWHDDRLQGITIEKTIGTFAIIGLPKGNMDKKYDVFIDKICHRMGLGITSFVNFYTCIKIHKTQHMFYRNCKSRSVVAPVLAINYWSVV